MTYFAPNYLCNTCLNLDQILTEHPKLVQAYCKSATNMLEHYGTYLKSKSHNNQMYMYPPKATQSKCKSARNQLDMYSINHTVKLIETRSAQTLT